MLFGLLLWGCSVCGVDAPLDYDDDAGWLCRPGLDGACPAAQPVRRVDDDGGFEDWMRRADDEAGLACFVVHPTADHRLSLGLATERRARTGAERFARVDVARFGQACDLYVPVYRCARAGVYARAGDAAQPCLDAAYADVAAAFDAFLDAEPARPLAVLGHGQGAQHLTRLLQERLATEPALAERLVAAYLIGWGVNADPEAPAQSPRAPLPVCADPTQTGCVVAYRSFLADGQPPEAAAIGAGEAAACVHPGLGEAGDASALLAAFEIGADDPRVLSRPEGTVEHAVLRFEDAFAARCEGEGADRGLAVAWVRSDPPPIDLTRRVDVAANGAQPLDLLLGGVDLVEDLLRRGASAR